MKLPVIVILKFVQLLKHKPKIYNIVCIYIEASLIEPHTYNRLAMNRKSVVKLSLSVLLQIHFSALYCFSYSETHLII